MLLSISAHGIREPLQGVDTAGKRILLDGFKRLRCAQKLNIGIVPYRSLADDEAWGIIKLIRASNARGLSIVEQSRLIDELMSVHQMCNAEIAALLDKSRAWVSVRAGITTQMSDTVMDEIFKGRFPVYSFMYTLRRFMRLNGVHKKEIDEFVDAVAGRHLSIRDIDLLANAYFKGPQEFRQQVKSGNISWTLNRLKHPRTTGCSRQERQMLEVLETTGKHMRFIIKGSATGSTNAFYVQANLLSGGILTQLDAFTKAIRGVHDRTGQTQGDLSAQ